jgi:small subunit ribosomal protein S2
MSPISSGPHGIYIIDLQKTVQLFKAPTISYPTPGFRPSRPVHRHQEAGAESIAEEAERAGMFYVNNRWLGCSLNQLPDHQAAASALKKWSA